MRLFPKLGFLRTGFPAPLPGNDCDVITVADSVRVFPPQKAIPAQRTKKMFGFLRRVTVPILICLVFRASSYAAETIEGFTEPYRTIDISVGEPGVVTKLEVKPGQVVDQGEFLMALDTSVLEATLAVAKQKAEATGSLEAAQAEYSLRSERLQQIIQLRQRGHATTRELSRAQADVTIAEARLKLAREEQAMNVLDCKRIEAQIARRVIASPCDGIISEVHREIGESLLVTDPRIVTLVQLDKLRTRFSATPEQAAKLRVDQQVNIRLSNDKGDVPAVVERVSPVVDAKSGTIEVHVVIDNADQKLRSGTRCLLEVNDAKDPADSFAKNISRK